MDATELVKRILAEAKPDAEVIWMDDYNHILSYIQIINEGKTVVLNFKLER